MNNRNDKPQLDPNGPSGQQIQQKIRKAGWTCIVPVDPRDRQSNSDHEFTAADSPSIDWVIVVNGGRDGNVEGYRVINGHTGKSTPRYRSTHVPDPNEAVGAWERWSANGGGS